MKITNDSEAKAFSEKCNLGQIIDLFRKYTTLDKKCSRKLERESMKT